MLSPRFAKAPAATANYVVIAEVQNLHLAGRKVLKGDTIALTAAAAAHWLSEGVIELAPTATAATAAQTGE